MKRGRENFFFSGKSGLSAIVATLIIILLVLVASGIIWAVVRNVIQGGADKIELDSKCREVNFKSPKVTAGESSGIYVVTLERASGGDPIDGVKLSFFNAEGTSSGVLEFGVGMNGLDSKTQTIDTAEGVGVSSANRFDMTPYFLDDLGNEQICSETLSYALGSLGVTPLGGGEEGGVGEAGTGYLGDGIVQNPNGEEPPIAEECDGVNLNGQTCVLLGYESGDLSCDEFGQFDETACVAAVPSSCDGSWSEPEDEGVVCDGGANCQVTCECEVGFSAVGDGSCILNGALYTGTVDDMFTSANPFQFTSSSLPDPSTFNLVSSPLLYVNFGGIADSCRSINYHAEVPESAGTYYVRMSASVAGVVEGVTEFNIWEAANCGV